MLFIKRVLSIFILLFSLNSNADNRSILKMYNQFTAVSAASSKCMSPPEHELIAFLANYQMVTTLMHQEIKRRRPNFTEEQVKKAIKMGSNKITNAVNKVIETESCDSSKIKDLIKRFHVQAKWKPST